MTRHAATSRSDPGLAGLRKGGSISEILFLFECATGEVLTLRPVAQRLGLTVQAVSHLYRQLSRGGLVEVRAGRYRPTIAGYARLQGTLSLLAEEIAQRLEQLQVVRTTRAVAGEDLTPGQSVSLELEGGILVAHRGDRGPSRGLVRSAARAGGLVNVGELSGIVPIVPGSVRVSVVPVGAVAGAAWTRRIRALVRRTPHGLLAAQGLEAFHLVRSSGVGPVVHFGVAAACLEASRLGVPSLVFVSESDLARFLAPFASPSAPKVEVGSLASASSRRARGRRSKAPGLEGGGHRG